jgi:glycosyltransferase involved in cell wall biosynthesis
MRRKALVVGVHHWNSPFQVGSHAIARELAAEGWDVVFVSAPITPLHWLRPWRGGFRERLMLHRQGGAFDALAKVWHYVPFAMLAPDHRPVLNARWVFEHWQATSRPDVAKHIARHGFFDVDLLFMSSHFQPFWLDAVRYRRSVYRVADLNEGFPGYTAGAAAVETGIASRVDLVVTAAHTLAEPARRLGAREVMPLPNGIAFRDFSQRPLEAPREYRALKGPIAVYVGAFGPWVDLELIERCALALPHVQFVLIGPTDDFQGHWASIANVHPIGPRSRAELPAYLHHAQVGLIPFDRSGHPELVDHVHPLKLYEYLACGLPVVSTDSAEMRAFAHPATLCAQGPEFVAAISRALDCPGNPEDRIAFAAGADWQGRVAQLLDRIGL